MSFNIPNYNQIKDTLTRRAFQYLDNKLGEFSFATGDLKIAAYATPDAGWLLCDGTVYAVAVAPALATKLGIVYGGVLGTSFGVPDFRGRSPLGVGTGTATGATAHALGQLAGEETHVLSTTEMPSHNHGGATGGGTSGTQSANHTHGPNNAEPYFLTGGPLAPWSAGSGGGSVDTSTTTSIESATHTHSVPALSISAQGGGGAANNLGPSTAVNFFIKT